MAGHWCEACDAKLAEAARLMRKAMEHCPDPDFITLPDGQTCHRDSPMARDAWLRRQLEGLEKKG